MAKKIPPSNRVDHLANERTFLAWIRTSMALMAFGFVVERFAVFMKQIGLFLITQKGVTPPYSPSSSQTYSSGFGILLVALGALIGLFSYLRYRKIAQQIQQNDYRYSTKLGISLTVLVVIMGIFLVIYLLNP